MATMCFCGRNVGATGGYEKKENKRERVSIKIGGEEVRLFSTFVDNKKSLEFLKSEFSEVLLEVSQAYGISGLDETNWRDYYEKIKEWGDSSLSSKMFNENVPKLLKFFDIYENKEKNEKIYRYIERLNSDEIEETADLIVKNRELLSLLPYDSLRDYAEDMHSDDWTTPAPIIRFYINNAINYAIQYADNPNTASYAYFDGNDCTNFVSQILENGGIAQDPYTSVYYGWWHRNIFGWHSHSHSWTIADTFARYMGVGYSSTDHYNFTANIRKGDFIAADWDKDGDWDHSGFVVDRDNYVGSWGYYNYRVAQHSSNYIRWTSNPTNNWEAGSYRWGRVRR